MKKNKMLKIGIVSVIMILVLTSFSYATSIIPNDDIGPHMENETVQAVTANILGTLRWIGYAIAIGMLMFVGIKYVMASADEKASMKGLLVKVVIGSIILISADVIVSIVYNFNN